ncbi:hypothetical protein ABKE32_000497 [Escherichia albertii]|uniref:hypothetical protein n=1 Tax=Escherichia albertii TaxID=208962 RepID=UPI000743F15A|nr:hypothetical protein [Escherichia albertii]
MSYFGLDPTSERNQLSLAVENPVLPQEAGFFDNVLLSPLEGLVNGAINKPALSLAIGLDDTLSPYASMLDDAVGTSTEQWFHDQVAVELASVRAATPNPATTGTAGQILNNMFDMGGQFAIGSRLGGPVAGAVTVSTMQGGADYAESRARGVDPATALQKATVTGLTAGAGTLIPASIGLRSVGAASGVLEKAMAFGGDVAYSAGSNMAMGMAQRGFTHDILSGAGYEEMAGQYHALDSQALAVDAVLGVAFGGAGHFLHTGTGDRAPAPEVSQVDIDAALTTNSALHVETDAAPGIPADPISRTEHVASVNKALADISAGRPVDVSGILSHADFMPKDMNDFIRDVSVQASEFYPDLPLFYLDDGAAITGKTVSDHIALLQPDAAALMDRGTRESLTGEIHRSENRLETLSGELTAVKNEPPKGSGKALAQARAAHVDRVKSLNRDIDALKSDIAAKKTALADHSKGGKNFEAKADISRLRQGIVPERLKQSVTRQSAEELGQNIDIPPKSAPVEPEVSPGKTSAEKSADESAATVDGDAQLASHALRTNPDMVIQTEDAGGNMVEVRAADVMADADAVIRQAEQDASLFDAAVACFLGG